MKGDQEYTPYEGHAKLFYIAAMQYTLGAAKPEVGSTLTLHAHW